METSYQIRVKNNYLAFTFGLQGNGGGAITDNEDGFAVRTLKKESASLMNRGMECVVIRDGRAFRQGTVTEITPDNEFLVLKCMSAREVA